MDFDIGSREAGDINELVYVSLNVRENLLI